MRINLFVARATGMSRRAADQVIKANRISINGQVAHLGQTVSANDIIQLDGTNLGTRSAEQTIMLNKPVDYVCSRNGQGSKTVYDLLPKELAKLKPAGRLDKDSCGLLLLTNNGKLAQQLTHPSYKKEKIYEVRLDKNLSPDDKKSIEKGIELEDGLSSFKLKGEDRNWRVTMFEGRNRQIRRTFDALGYKVTELKRTSLGPYNLANLEPGQYKLV